MKDVFQTLKLAWLNFNTPPDIKELVDALDEQRASVREVNARVDRIEQHVGLARAVSDIAGKLRG